MTRRMPTLLCLFLAAHTAAAQSFPAPAWKDAPNPLASPDAWPGGEIDVFVSQFPKSLNYYLEANVFCSQLFDYMYDTLLSRHPVTLEHEPHLAERWVISEDKLTFTFWIDPQAKWSDGRPVTAEDVQWTYDAIMHTNNLTGAHKVALEKLERPEVLGPRTVRVRARELHWANLDAIAGLNILPRHAFEDLEFNRIHFEFPVVSGPYQLAVVNKGNAVEVTRRKDWWIRGAARFEGVFNFDRITFRFFKDRQNAFESFRKGDIDIYPVYTSRLWVDETNGERFTRNWIVKQRIYNQDPVGFQGWVMNMRHPPFDDVRVRKAVALLIDRQRMNRTIMFDQYEMHRSYWEDLYDADHPCSNEAIEYDPEAARALLAEAGYRANPETGILEKDGRPLHLRMLARDAAWQKFYDIIMESMKDVGIRMTIDMKDWASWSKDMDEHNFQITGAAWGAGLFKNPEPMWHSREADRASGFNYAGYANPRVDALIEKQKAIFDVEARHAICREIDQIIYKDFPYALGWFAPYVRLLYWNKFGTPPTVLSKYGDERSAYAYWWYDEDAAADLELAMEEGTSLPRRPATVAFDDVFGR